jgi:hypothetical protein
MVSLFSDTEYDAERQLMASRGVWSSLLLKLLDDSESFESYRVEAARVAERLTARCGLAGAMPSTLSPVMYTRRRWGSQDVGAAEPGSSKDSNERDSPREREVRDGLPCVISFARGAPAVSGSVGLESSVSSGAVATAGSTRADSSCADTLEVTFSVVISADAGTWFVTLAMDGSCGATGNSAEAWGFSSRVSKEKRSLGFETTTGSDATL